MVYGQLLNSRAIPADHATWRRQLGLPALTFHPLRTSTTNRGRGSLHVSRTRALAMRAQLDNERNSSMANFIPKLQQEYPRHHHSPSCTPRSLNSFDKAVHHRLKGLDFLSPYGAGKHPRSGHLALCCVLSKALDTVPLQWCIEPAEHNHELQESTLIWICETTICTEPSTFASPSTPENERNDNHCVS